MPYGGLERNFCMPARKCKKATGFAFSEEVLIRKRPGTRRQQRCSSSKMAGEFPRKCRSKYLAPEAHSVSFLPLSNFVGLVYGVLESTERMINTPFLIIIRFLYYVTLCQHVAYVIILCTVYSVC